jgi:hypothetical protein
MEDQRKVPTDKGRLLEEQYALFFSGQQEPTWMTTDRNGNFVMPSLYQPARLSYSSRIG